MTTTIKVVDSEEAVDLEAEAVAEEEGSEEEEEDVVADSEEAEMTTEEVGH